MACPWFSPAEIADLSTRARPSRAPLGAVFAGSCLANPHETPVGEQLVECCNFGYSRGRCSAFPPASEADAVRFNGDLWILEREYSPVSHGSCSGPFPSAAVAAQAKAYKQTCLKNL